LKVVESRCGLNHTLIRTSLNQVFACGNNSQG
jgi:hypothetical protein